MSDPYTALGSGGYVALLALIVHLVVRLLRADKFNALLAKFKLPAVPSSWLPWLALLLGVLASTLDRVLGGTPWKESLPAALEGLIAGAFAIAGYEVGPKSVERAQRARAATALEAPEPEPATPKKAETDQPSDPKVDEAVPTPEPGD